MKVKDLLAYLEQFNPELEVVLTGAEATDEAIVLEYAFEEGA